MEPEGPLKVLAKEPGIPIAKSEEKMMDIRDDYRKMEYSEAVKKEYGNRLPENQKAFREALDAKAQELIRERKISDEEFNRLVPDKVLKEEKSIWLELGWTEENKNKTIKKLMDLLFIDRGRAENTLEILVASNKTFDEVYRNLSADEYNTYVGQLIQEKQEADRKGADSKLLNAMRQYQSGSQDGAARMLFLLDKLGLQKTDENPHINSRNDEYIQRFVLDDYFRERLNQEFDQQLPQNLYDMAWNITYHGEKEWGMQGAFPVLQMQMTDKDKEGNPMRDSNGKPIYRGRYVVNQSNLLRWLRERMFYRYDAFETDEVPNFYSVVTIDKGAYATVALATMIFDKSRYFRDEEGVDYEDLYNAFFIEPFDTIFDRTYAIEHQKVYDGGEDFAKAWEQWARLSKFTRKINGQSMVNRAYMLPLDLKGKDSDTKVGEALLQMFLGYYNLADFKQLQKYLGKDSAFFTRQGWIDAAVDFEGGGSAGTGTIGATGTAHAGEYFGEHQKYFDAAFNSDGSIKSVNDFLLFINPNYHEFPPQNLEKVLAQMLQNTVKEKFKSKQGTKDANGEDPIDQASLRYAWLKAYSWIGFAGARARNNFKPSGEPSGHHQETRLLYTDAYRMKYETFGGAGTRYTVPMFKQLSVPFFEATLSENATTPYIVGVNKDGTAKLKYRQKTAMEVMLEVRENDMKFEVFKKNLEREYERKIEQAANEEEKIALRLQRDRKLESTYDYYKQMHKQYTRGLEFNDNAMLVFSKNLIGMANPLYDRVMKGKETDFSKFITYDGLFRGPSFHREEWQDAFQNKLFTPLRYIFDANGGMQLNQIVRAPIYAGRDSKNKGIWVWKDQYLGERMIGHQVLDIEAFWKEKKEIPKEDWDELKSRGFRTRRGYIIRPDGKHEIDYNKVQDNKPMVYKQWMLMKLAADLWTHIDNHSTDPSFTLEHYDGIVEAIKNLTGDIDGDEYDMKGVRMTKRLFSKDQIKWLEKMSGKNRLFFRQFMSDIFIGDKRKKESMFGESVSVFLAGIFRGYG